MVKSQFYVFGLILFAIALTSFYFVYTSMLYPRIQFFPLHPKLIELKEYTKCYLDTYYKNFTFFENPKITIYKEGFGDKNVQINLSYPCQIGLFLNKRSIPYRIFHVKILDENPIDIINNRTLGFKVYCIEKCYIDLASYTESFTNIGSPSNVTFYIDICYDEGTTSKILYTDSMNLSLNRTNIILKYNNTSLILKRYFPCEKIYLRIYENGSVILSNFYENVSGSEFPSSFFTEDIHLGGLGKLYELIYFENNVSLEYLYKDFWPLPFSCSNGIFNITIPLDGSEKYEIFLVNKTYSITYKDLPLEKEYYVLDKNILKPFYLDYCKYSNRYIEINITYPDFYESLKKLIIS